MPTIPSHHVVGDAGHTSDHNAMADVLTDHESRVDALEAVQPTYMVKTGGNVINLTNPSGVFESVVIPAGTRDTTVYVEQVTYGGKRTYGLDTYGQARLGAATVTEVPLIVSGYSASHTGDLQRWRQYDTGATLARIGPDGTVYAPNVTPTTWTNISLASGLVAFGSGTAPPQYRLIGDRVFLRGVFKKSNGTDFTASADVGTLPPSASPPYLSYALGPSNFVNDEDHVRMEISSAGVIHFILRSGHTPAWISIENINFSRTA